VVVPTSNHAHFSTFFGPDRILLPFPFKTYHPFKPTKTGDQTDGVRLFLTVKWVIKSSASFAGS